MILLYDTGARIQEILDIKMKDIHLNDQIPCIYLVGKGHKTRAVPLMDKTIDHFHKYTKIFHLFRHTRAMHLYQAGIPLSYIKDFLGHANVNTTNIYASTDTSMMMAALEKVSI